MFRSVPILVLVFFGACRPHVEGEAVTRQDLEAELRSTIEESGAEVGLYARGLGPDADSIVLGADARMHAASTMKVPVMMRLYLDHQQGVRSLDTFVPITRTFASIVDGSPFVLPRESDSDSAFYDRIGEQAPIREMIERMITHSSNLATNLLIQLAEPARINAMLRSMGADSMEVLRGVEDLKAFEAGLSNTTTARALGRVMAALATDARFTEDSRQEMLAILERQHFRDGIPAGLPPSTRVANKTGWITGINHDAAIAYPDNGAPFVLVVLVRNHPVPDQANALIARLATLVWRWNGTRGGPR